MDIDYENYNLEEKYEGSDLDIEEDYLKRLKEQRIRVSISLFRLRICPFSIVPMRSAFKKRSNATDNFARKSRNSPP